MAVKSPFSGENINKLLELVVKYVEVKSELVKLQIKENVFQVIASLVLAFMLLIFAFLILFFISSAASGIINDWLESKFLGQLIIAGIYSVLLLILFYSRKKIINSWFMKIIAEDHFNEINKTKSQEDGSE